MQSTNSTQDVTDDRQQLEALHSYNANTSAKSNNLVDDRGASSGKKHCVIASASSIHQTKMHHPSEQYSHVEPSRLAKKEAEVVSWFDTARRDSIFL
jgi:hypothetical protein